MAPAAHVSAVRSLYKRILLLHRFMPIDLRALGDQYVKDEFRRHKTASAEEVTRFMAEWQVRQTCCCQCHLTAEKTHAFKSRRLHQAPQAFHGLNV